MKTKMIPGGEKYFTIEEANKMLPLIRNIIRDIHICWAVYGYSAMKAQAWPFICEINQLGCIYCSVNWNTSIVEFPTVINNEIVMLNWKSSEEDIRYFRECDDDPTGIMYPIPEDYLNLFSRNTDKIKSE